jgi:predicted nuclease with TOPRIM domain
MMEAKNYCATMQTELDSWKAKTRDAIRKFDTMPAEEMDKLRPFLTELKAVVQEHTARLESLSKECPADLGGERAERGTFAGLKRFWRELGEGEYQWYRPHL